MIEWIHQRFVLFKARRLYQRLVKSEAPSFEEGFKRRVAYLAAMLELQFKGEVIVSYGDGKAIVVRNSLVVIEITIFHIGAIQPSTYLVARTNIEPTPHWWLGLAFAGMKWSVARFPTMQLLTHEKPREP